MIYLNSKMFYVALQAGFSYYQGDSFISGWFLNALMHKFLPNSLKTVTNSWYSEIDFSGYGLVSIFSTTPPIFWWLLFSSLFIHLSIHAFIWSFILQYVPWTHCVPCCRYTGAQGRHTTSVMVFSSRCKQTSNHQIAI